MGFVANLLGGGAARHAANVANVRAQLIAQQQQQAGQTMYNNITGQGRALNSELIAQGGQAYNQLTGLIPGVTSPFQPMIQAGQAAASQYQQDLPQLTNQYAPTMAQLAGTPGYQFALQQGLESTQNAAAARGLGVSGASLKAAGNYATGLAQQTYAQDAGIYQQGQQIAANNLLNGMSQGTSAANASGSLASGLQQAATGAQQSYNQDAASIDQNALTTGAADYLNQFNSGASTSLAGNQQAVAGQIAYNNALGSGINIIANGINQGVGLLKGGASSAGQAASSGSGTLAGNAINNTFGSSSGGGTLFGNAINNIFAPAPTAYGQAANVYGQNNALLAGGIY